MAVLYLWISVSFETARPTTIIIFFDLEIHSSGKRQSFKFWGLKLQRCTARSKDRERELFQEDFRLEVSSCLPSSNGVFEEMIASGTNVAVRFKARKDESRTVSDAARKG